MCCVTLKQCNSVTLCVCLREGKLKVNKTQKVSRPHLIQCGSRSSTVSRPHLIQCGSKSSTRDIWFYHIQATCDYFVV